MPGAAVLMIDMLSSYVPMMVCAGGVGAAADLAARPDCHRLLGAARCRAPSRRPVVSHRSAAGRFLLRCTAQRVGVEAASPVLVVKAEPMP